MSSNQSENRRRTDDASARPIAVKGERPWITVAILLAAALFLYLVRSILPPFVIAAMLAYVSSPAVRWLEARARIRRAAAVVIFLLVVLVPLGALGWTVGPALMKETNQLATDGPNIITNLLVQTFGSERITILGQDLNARAISIYFERGLLDVFGSPRGTIQAAALAVEVLLETFLTVVLLVYFLLDPGAFAAIALRLVPAERRAGLRGVATEIHAVLGRYLRGLGFLVVLMSTATWLGLTLLFHLPYALPIAIATGFLEIIPFLGPVAAATIAGAVALSQGGPQLALWVALFYFVLRQLEDQLVMPLVIGRALELHPAITIFAVLSGTALWGVLGALLAIPVAATVKIAFERLRPA